MEFESTFKNAIDVNGVDTATLLTFGLPIPKGACMSASHISLSQLEHFLDAEFECITRWADNSLRWIRCNTIVKCNGPITLHCNGAKLEECKIAQHQSKIAKCRHPEPPLSPSIGSFFTHPKFSLNASASLTLSGNSEPVSFTLLSNKRSATRLSQTYTVKGVFRLVNQRINFFSHITLSTITNEYSVKVRIQNPSAASHKGGQWDLSDPSSLNIDDFSISFHNPNTKTAVLVNNETPETSNKAIDAAFTTDIFTQNYTSLTQFGSGGEHWQSPIHWDAQKISTVKNQGFALTQQDQIIYTGLRAQPLIAFINKAAESRDLISTLTLSSFWQNFPVGVTTSDEACGWKLLFSNTELQGGESKTWTFTGRFYHSETVDHTEEPNSKSLADYFRPKTQVQITYSPGYVNQCNVFPNCFLSATPSSLGSLILKGLTGNTNFFNKRERKDVFGWRHFGELDADHEAIYAINKDDFISHYNNQYDPLMGMTLQFLHTGNCRWLDLVKPLSQHIQDIDIYDTVQDKAEYNGGLMWHTDHYLSAQTSTHRSNSKHHQHAYEGFLGGGGPGGQHCYTTGLALQYLLFCDEQAKQKVIQLCTWIRNFYNGSGSVIERTFRLITIDFKQRQLTNIGIKAPGYKYPLDRGTGNFLTALMDNYELTSEPALLSEMGIIIQETIHPNDDIDLRELNNIELSWFYTIFLQAVVRYLLLKESVEQIDADYWYARHSLLHFGNWMLNEETFYLDKSEELEFPNDTWCAQEVRKANLFYFLYYFSHKHNEEFIDKATLFYAYINAHLSTSNEAEYTRILAILMQNDGVEQKFRTPTKPFSPIKYQAYKYGKPPNYSKRRILASYFFDVAQLARSFSLKSEWRWLSLRVKSALNK